MLNGEKINEIEQAIEKILIKKITTYSPETNNMPFHFRLLGRDRMALFSFIHSLNTSFGTSIFEPVAETLAKINYPYAQRQYVVGNEISGEAHKEIQNIINELSVSGCPNKIAEITRIQRLCRKGNTNKLKVVKADLFIKDTNNKVHLIDIKTTKPNISNFKDFKRTLLEWVAIYLHQYPKAKINTYIAIPYNPYEPKPYERWTLKGMIDLKNELMVAKEFWDFLGGEGAYEKVLDCFERVGVRLRPKLDEYFSKFK
ncbi:MAG TPA: TdeIII family type II restriction endonuclease [Candidatus Hydrogenedens sp.]|nr:TdeIII family type II restriction endonuclease [Candidatus Hydrogenedens sp.]HPP59327.1 TdeIII family type II restriction endonuclease [Candidatus Hydrogenedens sp.]